MRDTFQLTHLNREIQSLCVCRQPPEYRYLWEMAVSSHIPAFREDGRWWVAREDLPVIALVLGLRPAPGADTVIPICPPGRKGRIQKTQPYMTIQEARNALRESERRESKIPTAA